MSTAPPLTQSWPPTQALETGASPPPLDRDQVLAWLAAAVPPPRLRHILGVEALARELALAHGLDQDRAAQAGLLHDLAKYYPAEKLLAIARTAPLTLDPILEANPHLLHADVGAMVAQQEFGVADPQILSAIRCHTLGQPGMSPLDCVVFLADALEPNRGQSPLLAARRVLARQDLAAAVVQVSDDGIKHLLAKGKVIHPRTVLTRNWFLAVP